MPVTGPSCESRPSDPSLADRMAEGPLPLTAVLEYAADVAKVLGELHRGGAAHGEVALVAIRVNESGALLLPSHGRGRAANPREDVSAFGAVLCEMLAGDDRAGDGLHEAAFRLAAGCLAFGNVAPDLRRLALHLRVLGVLARLHEERRTPAARQPAAPTESKPSPGAQAGEILTPWNSETERWADKECPWCGGPVFRSCPRTLSERILSHLGIRFRRCHWCYYRYFRMFGVRIGREG